MITYFRLTLQVFHCTLLATKEYLIKYKYNRVLYIPIVTLNNIHTYISVYIPMIKLMCFEN